MRWVNETLPPRPRRRWLLTTVRLSMSSFAGMARTLVAVGTARLASMLVTTRAAAPFSLCVGDGADGALGGSGALPVVSFGAAGLVAFGAGAGAGAGAGLGSGGATWLVGAERSGASAVGAPFRAASAGL